MPEDPSESRQMELSEDVPSSSKSEAKFSPQPEGEERECTANEGFSSKIHYQNFPSSVVLSLHIEKEEAQDVCRVCHCAEPDKSGEAALKFLGISYPVDARKNTNRPMSSIIIDSVECKRDDGEKKGLDDVSENTSFGHRSDLEAGPCICPVDSLIELGCACKNDLATAHYACALRWFVSKGSIVCEICGKPAVNISLVDQNKVISAVKERDALQAQNVVTGSGQDGIVGSLLRMGMSTNQNTTDGTSTRRGQLLEVASWFDPHGNVVPSVQGNTAEQPVDNADEEPLSSVNPATKWAVEGTGILIATGLLTVTITWLLAPKVGKGVARKGLNILLGGLCALSIVVFLRFGVLPRIKYGPARYWAILLVFWFLVFGVWASSTRSTRAGG